MYALNIISCILFSSVFILIQCDEDLLFGNVLQSPMVDYETMTRDAPTKNQNVTKPNVKIYSLNVATDIKYRYALTQVTSRVANHEDSAQEVVFSLVVPETAFVSKFYMEIDNKTYNAYVKEKEAAKIEYTQAVASGFAAAHVELSARDSNTFRVSVNVEPQTKVTFGLTYEQFLARTLGRYEHIVNISPGQVVRNMSVTVNILEANNITELEIPELKTSNEITEDKEKPNSLAHIVRNDGNTATVKWEPTIEQQEKMNADVGVKGQLIVRYDVDRTANPDQILVDEGYFVHFYAPPNLPTLNKHVIFVLDLSGSMFGVKLAQLKEAMMEILSDLRDNDYFSIIFFSNTANVWSLDAQYSPEMFNEAAPAQNLTFHEHVIKANEDNIKKAKAVIKGMNDHGGTNIIDGLRKAITMANIGKEKFMNQVEIPEPIVIFLTDGEPNVEMSDTDEIIKEVEKLNVNNYQIFSLAFGNGADFNFLRKLSLANSAFARNIYEASDAALQLKNFYKQVASPLLSNVKFNYIPGQVDFNSTTKTKFPTLYSGSELVVAGKLNQPKEDLKKLIGSIEGRSLNGSTQFEFPEIHNVENDTLGLNCPIDFQLIEYPNVEEKNRTQGHLERAWAYLYVQQLLDENSLNEEKVNASKAKALDLSLQYSFVTPLTSLVVVKPNETSTNAIQTTNTNPDEPVHMFKVGGLSGYSAMYQPAVLSASAISAPGFASASHPMMAHKLMNTVAYSFLPPPSSESFDSDINSIKQMTPDMQGALENYAKLHNFTLGKNTEVPNTPYQECNNSYTIGSTPTVLHHCKHITHCLLSEITVDMNSYEPHHCVIENKFLGVCCPDDIQPLNSSTSSTPASVPVVVKLSKVPQTAPITDLSSSTIIEPTTAQSVDAKTETSTVSANPALETKVSTDTPELKLSTSTTETPKELNNALEGGAPSPPTSEDTSKVSTLPA